jgi:hypothetical protein
MKPKINYGTCTLGIALRRAEEHYNAKYIGDFCLKTKDGTWTESPAAIFYAKNPDASKGHTHYFGLFMRDGQWYITAGDSAFSEPINAIMGSDGEVVYSRFRHDFRSLKSGEGSIDGGRDYLRVLSGEKGFPKQVLLHIEKDKLVVMDVQQAEASLV